MKKLYIVFDQIPSLESGGLIVTYLNLVEQMKPEFQVEIISAFQSSEKAENLFSNCKIITLCRKRIDNRFFRIMQYVKEKDIRRTVRAMWSMACFFLSVFPVKYKMKKLIENDAAVISVSPTASIFIPSEVKFVQDIHSSYEYFWGKNVFGRMQTALMSKPALTVFRNKEDAAKGAKKFRSTYMYNFHEEITYDIENYDIHARKRRILYVGRLHPDKDPLRLLECAKMLKEHGEAFQLDIYGTGILQREMEKKIIQYQLQDCVSLKGYTTDKNVYSKYGILWLTSRREGYGLVIVEAKANATPVITSNWGSAVDEVVENGTDGHVASTNEEIVRYTEQLFEDEEFLTKMAEAAYRNYQEKYSNDTTKKRLRELLLDIEWQ